jgi:hypothetical protein
MPKRQSKKVQEKSSPNIEVKPKDDNNVDAPCPDHVASSSMTVSAWQSQSISLFWDAYAGNRESLLEVLDSTMISQTCGPQRSSIRPFVEFGFACPIDRSLEPPYW